jgi:serine phosphatase RsbU (regulator of sigma subunit)
VSAPHVQLIVDRDIEAPGPLRAALSRVRAQVSIRSLDRAMTDGVAASADVCVVLPGRNRASAELDALMARASEEACGTMLIPAERAKGMDGRLSAGELNADELAGRIRALCEIRHPLRRMREELSRLREGSANGNSPGRDFDEQMRLASQIQSDLLPEATAEAGPLRISTLYLPADFVSGDTYDITRLDEDRFGFSLADATGHGLPAALLAILVKNSLRGKEIYNGSYRIVEPDEVLSRLNQELLAANLRQCHFITALHAIFDRNTRRMRWARGGVPYPILFQAGQEPRQIRSEGGLIGAFENQSFEVAEVELRTGDVLLFYTDGLEALLLGRRGGQGDEAILRTGWVRGFVEAGPEDGLDEIRRLTEERDPSTWSRDDITALAMRMS